jgi:hypothetical protein
MFSEQDLIFLSPEKNLRDLDSAALQKRVWIVAAQEAESATMQDFLAKILLAVQRDLQQDAFFYEVDANDSLQLATAFQVSRPEQILVFGLRPEQIGLRVQVQAYQSFDFQGVRWLFADPLGVLEPDKTKKGLLWTALKGMFTA